jgi:hypothetical protein
MRHFKRAGLNYLLVTNGFVHDTYRIQPIPSSHSRGSGSRRIPAFLPQIRQPYGVIDFGFITRTEYFSASDGRN